MVGFGGATLTGDLDVQVRDETHSINMIFKFDEKEIADSIEVVAKSFDISLEGPLTEAEFLLLSGAIYAGYYMDGKEVMMEQLPEELPGVELSTAEQEDVVRQICAQLACFMVHQYAQEHNILPTAGATDEPDQDITHALGTVIEITEDTGQLNAVAAQIQAGNVPALH